MALGNILALLWCIGTAEKRGKLAAVLWYFFTLLMVVMSRSATAVILWFVLTGTTAFYFAWVAWGHRLQDVSRRTIAGILAGILAAAILAITAIFQLTGKNIQLTGRIPLWKNLIDQVVSEKPWFGHGMDTLWYSREFQRWASEASGWGDVAYVLSGHNGYVDILLHLGAVGLLLLIVVLVGAVVRAVSRAIAGRTWLDVFPLLALIYILTANVTVSYLLEQENFHWMLLTAILFLPEGKFQAGEQAERLKG
jgi:O-antigen ligase